MMDDIFRYRLLPKEMVPAFIGDELGLNLEDTLQSWTMAMKGFSYPPTVSSTEAQVDGQVYNAIRIALNRLGAPLHVVVPGSWGYEMVLDEERWFCRDRWQISKPVVVLCDFKPQKRTRIDEQVSCRRLCSRSYAGMDVSTLLREVSLVLRKRLENRSRSGKARLLRLNVTLR